MESTTDLLPAINAHDLGRVRAALPEGFAVWDRRRTGLGRVANSEEYLASLAAVFEQSPDAFIEMLYVVEAAAHGSLSVGRWSGTLASGGPFESLHVRLILHGGRYAETFEIDDLELARARFEELCAARA
jgi:hypothetical protein